jgi:hypothetical protein
MFKKALAVMLVVCVASSSAIDWDDTGDWWLLIIGSAVTIGGGVMFGVGWETEEGGFYRKEPKIPENWVHQPDKDKQKLTNVGISGLAVGFLGLAAVFTAVVLQPFREPDAIIKGTGSSSNRFAPRTYAPSPVVDPIVSIPTFDLPLGSVGGGVEFGLPKVEGLRLSLSVADVGAYAIAR